MGGYPPGTSRRDLARGGIIEPHNHEHEWVPNQDMSPIIEDGAAIFHERCIYAEGRYNEKWSCDETRSYRFEYSKLEAPDGRTWELPTIEDWDDVDEEAGEKVIAVEESLVNFGPAKDSALASIDPDPEAGEVVVAWNGWKLTFEPQ